MTGVRRATPGDARAIAEVQVETWRATYPGVFPQNVLDTLDVDARQRLWQGAAANERVGLFVSERGDRIVGFASVGPCRDLEDTGELYAIYVLPDAWGKGAGPELMETAVIWLAERWPEAVLWVAEQNPRARRFYERSGWRLDASRVDEVEGTPVPEVRYRISGLHRR